MGGLGLVFSFSFSNEVDGGGAWACVRMGTCMGVGVRVVRGMGTCTCMGVRWGQRSAQ